MIEQVTAGIDWLTLTLPLGATMDNEWIHDGQNILHEIAKEGYDIAPRGLLGYKGYSAANCFVGTREDGHMIQLCGRFADPWFRVLYRPDAHCSRIDVQVTVKHDVMPRNVAGKAYNDTLHQDGAPERRKRRKTYLITGSDGGQTLYVGAPSSDQRGRLYNKEVQSESPEYIRTWRYEVVLRNERAQPLCDRLLALKEEASHFLAAYVAMWWETRGIQTPWSVIEAPAPLPPQKTLPTDVERQLKWLSAQVAPTISRLIAAGYRDTIYAALNLNPPVNET